MKITLLPLLFSGFVWLHADTAVWDGGVGDGNFFNPLNWDIRPDQAGLQPPPAGFISDEGKTDRHLLLEMAAARGEQRRLDLNGRNLSLRSGGTLDLLEEGVTGGKESLLVLEEGHLSARYAASLLIRMNGGSTLRLEGGDQPLNTSRIEIAPDCTGRIVFTRKNTTWVRKVELQKMTREGQPLREGADFHLVEEGNGSILRFLAVKGVSKR
jgi:hypothetical protein